MRILIHPKYEHLRPQLARIEELFEHEGHEIHRGRNVLRTLTIGDLVLCVKRYGRMPLGHRLATSLYKNSKARNAFVKPLLLRERGFDSPEPVALITVRRSLLRSVHYFVCLHSHYRHSLTDAPTLPDEERRALIESFAQFAARLHAKGFLHDDFSSSNILYDHSNNRFHFTLVDTNSVRFGRKGISVERGCANFARLTGDADFLDQVAASYAQQRKADVAHCQRLVREARQAYLSRCEARAPKMEKILHRAQQD